MKKIALFFGMMFTIAPQVFAAPQEPLFSLVEKEQASYLSTLKELVSIESGSRDREGLDRISQLIFNRLKALGGQVEFIEPGPDIYQMYDTPAKPGLMVKAEFKGSLL